MRKFLCFTLVALMMLGGFTVLAEDYNSVELEIQLGSYIAYVNGEARSVEAPFLKDGVTVAPVEAVSAAFGEESTEKVTYNDVEVVFAENSAVALVDEEEKIMPTAAVRVNGSLMIPVRFVCDIFNALIEFEEATGTVSVSKSADFTELFNKPVSGYWCDEDYGWMIQLPTDYDHTKNVYDGSLNQFINSAGDAAFLVIIEKNKYQNTEQLRTHILAQNSGEILRKEEIITLSDGTKACYFEFEAYAAVVAIHGEYLVDVEFITTSVSKFELYREDARKGVKSLTFNIDQAKKPENVSTLNEGGFKVYTDKVLGFNVNRMESWTEPTYLGTNVSVWEYSKYDLISKLNSDEFFDGEMKVSVFSKEEGDTPESLAEAELKRVKQGYNSSYLRDVASKSFVRKGEPGVQVDFTIVYNGKKQINSTKFFVKDDYIYKAEYYVIYSAKSDESKLGLEEIKEMYESIRITGVDASKLGTVIDISRRVDLSVKQKYTNQNRDFEISLPAAWSTGVSANAVTSINLRKYIEIEAEKLLIGSNLEKAKAYFAEEYPGAKFYKDKLNGKEAYKIVATTVDSGDNIINVTAYMFVHEKAVYYVAGLIKEVYETAENKAMIDTIIKSFKLI